MDKLLWKVIQFLSESVSDSELELSLESSEEEEDELKCSGSRNDIIIS